MHRFDTSSFFIDYPFYFFTFLLLPSFPHNFLCPFKSYVDMAADVFLANGVVESCLFESGMHTWVHPRKHHLYVFFLAHGTKVGKVVDTGGIDERHLSHSDDAHLWTVAKGCHNLLKTVSGTEEIRTVDFVDLHSLGDRQMLQIALDDIALLVYFVHDNLNIGGLRHTLHKQQTGNDQSHLDGNGEVEDYSEEEGDEQYGYVAFGILHQGEERAPAAHAV